jgi:hypothetical protein
VCTHCKSVAQSGRIAALRRNSFAEDADDSLSASQDSLNISGGDGDIMELDSSIRDVVEIKVSLIFLLSYFFC